MQDTIYPSEIGLRKLPAEVGLGGSKKTGWPGEHAKCALAGGIELFVGRS